MSEGSTALVTGALGLVGAAAVRRFLAHGLDVVGVDNDMRAEFFGPAASNRPNLAALERHGRRYRHRDIDIRDGEAMEALLAELGPQTTVIVHAAAQPSHDWAATHPLVDWEINATATLRLLEAFRRHAPQARFLFMSTNKVYGDLPNRLPLHAEGDRLELDASHPYHAHGIDESMSIDQSRHSHFGVSKAAADLMVQEYAAKFGLATTVFRAGCLTGEDHHGAKAHGFLAYLASVARRGEAYEIIGHGGRQVRDNLHADDLAEAFVAVLEAPPMSGVFNMGGGRPSSVSILEALEIAGDILGRPVPTTFADSARFGDHAWWITDTRSFQRAYPDWRPRRTGREIIAGLLEAA